MQSTGRAWPRHLGPCRALTGTIYLNGYIYVCEVLPTKGTVTNVAWWPNRKWEIEYGGLQTGCTRLVDIFTAISMFWRSSIRIERSKVNIVIVVVRDPGQAAVGPSYWWKQNRVIHAAVNDPMVRIIPNYTSSRLTGQPVKRMPTIGRQKSRDLRVSNVCWPTSIKVSYGGAARGRYHYYRYYYYYYHGLLIGASGGCALWGGGGEVGLHQRYYTYYSISGLHGVAQHRHWLQRSLPLSNRYHSDGGVWSFV